MQTDGMRRQTPTALASNTSRRCFLHRIAGLAAAGSLRALAQQSKVNSTKDKRSILAYVGTYSSPQGPEGSPGRGQGIYLFETNPSTGVLLQQEVFLKDTNPAWLAFDPSKKHLYSANETATY